jgi:3D (Asp-Asp-Asp) domain-containing protein
VIARSLRLKVGALCGALVGFVLLYEVTTYDSQQFLARDTSNAAAVLPPASPGPPLKFVATAYCKGSTTATGVAPRRGVAAADPVVLPSGTVIQLDAKDSRYNGVYTVMDNGPAVKHRELDLYMWSCNEALAFGRRAVSVTVLRLGWNPGASEPHLIRRLLQRAERAIAGE